MMEALLAAMVLTMSSPAVAEGDGFVYEVIVEGMT